MSRKGIILAGGTGTRLFPMTLPICKQLLPVYDKPMIFYPLATLMLSGIREFLVITSPREVERMRELFGSGEQWGLSFSYVAQEKPRGLAEAFILGEKFINNQPVSLILGDNLFYGQGFGRHLIHTAEEKGPRIFAYYIKNPSQYGVVELDENANAISIEEKPKNPKSHYAVTGLYFYDADVIDIAKNLQPSARGELEITDINETYLKRDSLKVHVMGRGMAWMDMGSFETLLQASQFVQTVEARQGLKIACPEEIAWRMVYISDAQLAELARPLCASGYGNYLLDVLKQPRLVNQ